MDRTINHFIRKITQLKVVTRILNSVECFAAKWSNTIALLTLACSFVAIIAAVVIAIKSYRAGQNKKREVHCEKFKAVLSDIFEQYMRVSKLSEILRDLLLNCDPNGITVKERKTRSILEQLWILKASKNWADPKKMKSYKYEEIFDLYRSKNLKIYADEKDIDISQLEHWVKEIEEIISESSEIQTVVKSKIPNLQIFLKKKNAHKLMDSIITHKSNSKIPSLYFSSGQEFADSAISDDYTVNWDEIDNKYNELRTPIERYILCSKKLNMIMNRFQTTYPIAYGLLEENAK